MDRASHRKTGSHPSAATRAGLSPVVDCALDCDRSASMADEGGRAGATMDLREQVRGYDAAAAAAARRHAPATSAAPLWWGAAGAAAGLAAGLWLRRRRASAS